MSPNIDLLTLLLGMSGSSVNYSSPSINQATPNSEHRAAQEDTPLHLEAANPSNVVTKSTLRALAERFAHALRSRFGIGASGPNKDVVVVMTSGQPLVAAAFYGIIAADGVFSAASPSSTTAELAKQIRQGKSKLVICSPDLQQVAVEAVQMCEIRLDSVFVLQSSPKWGLDSVQGGFGVDCTQGERLTWRRITDPEELKTSLLVLLYNPGATGVPKGVMLSRLNLVCELYIPSVQGREGAARQIAAGGTMIEYRTLVHLPVAHIAGVFGYLIAPFYSAGTVYCMRKFECPFNIPPNCEVT